MLAVIERCRLRLAQTFEHLNHIQTEDLLLVAGDTILPPKLTLYEI